MSRKKKAELPVMLNEREKWRGDLPAEINGDDPGTVGGDLEEHGHCEVEVRARGVTPPTIVVGEGEIRRAEVCSGDEDGRVPRAARSVVGALDLKASSAAQPIVEQRSAQCCIVNSIALAIQIPVTTRAACKKLKISGRILRQNKKERAVNESNGPYPLCQKRRRRRKR